MTMKPKRKKPTLESRLRRRYTKVRKCNKHDDRYRVTLMAGSQQFSVGEFGFEDEDEAQWFRTMLSKALATIVRGSR